MSADLSSARGYGYKWQKARAAYLKKHPLCVYCIKQGKVQAADVVDHIVPHKGDMKLFWDSDNWQSLCKLCHDSHKKRFEMTGKQVGCDVTGMPIDPSHHWHSKLTT